MTLNIQKKISNKKNFRIFIYLISKDFDIVGVNFRQSLFLSIMIFFT